MMNQPRFPVRPAYRPTPEAMAEALAGIIQFLEQQLEQHISRAQPIHEGMNTNFALYCHEQSEPSFQLKIFTHRGYPSLEKIQRCQTYLADIPVITPEILLIQSASSLVPNGFLVQRWLRGTPATDCAPAVWVPLFVQQLQSVHSLTLPYFGTIEAGPTFRTIRGYYHHLDEVIAHSFGQTLCRPLSIWELQAEGWVTPGFVDEVMDRIRSWAADLGVWEPHLCHGDMSAGNLLLTEDGPAILDWDESRSHVWPAELARTLFFYDDQRIADAFLQHYEPSSGESDDAESIITLEHVRQLLRYLCMNSFNQTERGRVRDKNRMVEQRIQERWQRRYLT